MESKSTHSNQATKISKSYLQGKRQSEPRQPLPAEHTIHSDYMSSEREERDRAMPLFDGTGVRE